MWNKYDVTDGRGLKCNGPPLYFGNGCFHGFNLRILVSCFLLVSPSAEAFCSHLTFTIKASRCCVAAREDERRAERFRQLDRTRGLSLEKCSGGGKEGRRWAHSSALYLPLTQINPVTACEPHCLWRSFYSFNPLCLSRMEV